MTSPQPPILPNDTDTLLIIPARWGSSRLPGKPLIDLAGKSMLARVLETANNAREDLQGVQVVVTTEDTRVLEHASTLGAYCSLTSASCKTGTDRAQATLAQLNDAQPNNQIQWVINLQGDAPLTPPALIRDLITQLRNHPETKVLTPATQLTWRALDQLRTNKQDSPFSGTTVTFTPNHRALWFSKCIIPAIRKEKQLREISDLSPVWRHIGVYGFRADVLNQYVKLPETHYEALEGLEQLRLLESGIPVHILPAELGDLSALSGVDTPEDAARISKWLNDRAN